MALPVELINVLSNLDTGSDITWKVSRTAKEIQLSVCWKEETGRKRRPKFSAASLVPATQTAMDALVKKPPAPSTSASSCPKKKKKKSPARIARDKRRMLDFINKKKAMKKQPSSDTPEAEPKTETPPASCDLDDSDIPPDLSPTSLKREAKTLWKWRRAGISPPWAYMSKPLTLSLMARDATHGTPSTPSDCASDASDAEEFELKDNIFKQYAKKVDFNDNLSEHSNQDEYYTEPAAEPLFERD